ncbi:MFS transporter [Bombilactobacillus bombi]|uniref:MFS transporter n=1 Tax=Bombilactobacillus bombi TaxID=1303590 RepID=UPI0015E61F9D|nr:MFS transporter [Bombilactobacillus bombi]
MILRKIHYAWWIFLSTCIISLVGFGFIVDVIGLFFEPISASFHISRAGVSLMATFQNIACAITLLFAGKIMEKVNVKWLLTVCYMVVGLGFISLAFAKNIQQFYIVWTIIGIMQPFALTLSIPVLLGNWFKKYLGTVMGIALGLSAIGGSLFNPIISNIITNLGWRAGWIFEGIITLVTILPFTLFVIRYKPTGNVKPYGYEEVESVSDSNSEWEGVDIKQALKTPMFYLISFAMIALQWVAGLVQHVSPYVVSIKLPLTTGAAVVSGIMLGAAVGKASIGWFLDHFNNKIVIIVYSCFGILGWSSLMFFRALSLLVSSGFILGLGQGIMLVSLPYFIRKQFGAKDYNNILSIISMMGNFATAIAVSVDGKIFDITGSYNLPLTTNSILYILGGSAVVFSIYLSNKYFKKQHIIQ